MGKTVKLFHVEFTNDQTVFWSGQVISGHLVVHLNTPITFEKVYLRLVGGANVRWSEQQTRGHGKNRRTVTKYYHKDESYFKKTFNFCGEDAKDYRRSLPSGEHRFPFSFQLPQKIPSSFEADHGRVRYYAQASIQRGTFEFDKNTKRMFTVIDTFDLNHDPDAGNPGHCQDFKTLCCWCCESGPIEADFHIEKRGYVPGEYLNFNANIENHCGRTLSGTQISIKQNVTLKAQKSKWEEHDYVETEYPEDIDNGDSWKKTDYIQVPSLPPTFLRHCKIIDVEYVVQFKVRVPFGSRDMRMLVPITIGTIPIMKATPPDPIPPEVQQIQPDMEQVVHDNPGMVMEQIQQPPGPAPTSAPAPPPPSYQAAVSGPFNVMGEDDNQYTRGDKQYAPQYQFYDWSQVQQGPK